MNKNGDSEDLEAATSPPCKSAAAVSPLGKSRYGRTRKPKISEDFCNIDDLFSDAAAVVTQKAPVKKLVLSSPKHIEIDSLFMPKQIQPLPKQQQVASQRTPLNLESPPKLVSVPLKERKFFKSNAETDTQSVNVTEVLKIIKSGPLESPPKPLIKPILRTYGNRRKLTSKNEVIVESFALPDNPIIPLKNNDLPAKTSKKTDLNLPNNSENKKLPIDIQDNNDSDNCTLNLNYSVVFDEMQIKAEECMVKNTIVKKAPSENDKIVSVNGLKERKRKKMSLETRKDNSELIHVKKKLKNCNTEANEKESSETNDVTKKESQERDKNKNEIAPQKLNKDEDFCVSSEKNNEQHQIGDSQEQEKIKNETAPPKINQSENISIPLEKSGVEATEVVEESKNETRVELKKQEKLVKKKKKIKVASPRVLRSSFSEAKLQESVDLFEDVEAISKKEVADTAVKSEAEIQQKQEKETKSENDENRKKLENQSTSDFAPGDIIWARIGNYPYWPSLISLEPEQKEFKKDRIIGRGGKATMYHVRFFGDKGRRAWVNSACMLRFKSEKDLEVLAKTDTAANKSMYSVPPSKQLKWETAVSEALSIQNKTTEEKFDCFFNMLTRKRKISDKSVKARLKPKKRREDEDYVPPRRISTSTTTTRKSIIKTDIAASECSLSDTDTSSKFSVNSTNSLEAQAALYKRNNVFKGAHKGRVCEVCEKQDDVLKCKTCLGYFHAACTSKTSNTKQEEIVEEKIVENNTSKSVDQRKLSLAEQIDLKMKEIMKKFDYKTIYADSTSDSASSEDSGSEKAKEFSKPSVPEKKIIQHVTADCITFAETEEPPAKQQNSEDAESLPVSTTEDVQNKKDFKCAQCLSNIKPPCFICNRVVDERQKCSLHACGKVYHKDCLNLWPQSKTSTNDSFVCPMHVCHTCVSDNPKENYSRYATDNLVRCIRCPSTYHSSSYCIPAGTIVLSTKQVVCVRHLESTKYNKTVNTTWCFLCSSGGDLICCETCPTSVHPKCLKVDVPEMDKYICDDCESGRYPLYDEIVWVKMGKYRWWPAVILFPNEIPENVNNLPHTQGEFVVKFFGTHDHHWVSRGRVFLFQEDDEEQMGKSKKKMDVIFRKAVDEAVAAFQLKQNFKMAREAEMKTNLKPPAYVKIKSNKPVGNVRQFDGNTSNSTPCNCDANEPFPCGPDSDCLNRLLLTECDPTVCPAGDRCNNQRFEKREYPPMVPYKTQGRGWGLKTLAPIRKGQFVVEYVGELIDEQEYQKRIQKMHEQKEENYYFLTIDNNRTIDAGPKGNLARFMNHSCQPNCETQKWTVNGDTRVGLFANEDIPAGSELTFNYNLECVGKEKKICRCGASNCSGYIGVKAKSSIQDEIPKKPKRLLRKKKTSPPRTESIDTTAENLCFVCNKSGDVMGCNNKICNKYYHLQCVALTAWPEGKWVCPWHNCNICAKRTIRCCVKCLNSYCPPHSEGYVRYDKLLGFVCFEHDPTKESPEIPAQDYPKQTDTSHLTEETDITSTTSDDLNDLKTKDDEEVIEQETANNFKELSSSTPLKNRRDSDTSQSSVVVVVEKKKRGRKKKRKNLKKQGETKALPVETAKNNSLTIQNEVKLTSTVPSRHLRAAKRTAETSSQSEFEKFLKRQQLDFENNLPIRKRSRARCETTL